jgi:hypothetical protein
MLNENQDISWWQGPFTWIASISHDDVPKSDLWTCIETPFWGAEELSRLLLSMDGNKVVIPFDEKPISKLLIEQGRLVEVSRVDLKIGGRSACHRNSARYWNKHKQRTLIGTGYALSEDGLWRRHSWCQSKGGSVVIETTVERKVYFGVLLDNIAAIRFCADYFTSSRLHLAIDRLLLR